MTLNESATTRSRRWWWLVSLMLVWLAAVPLILKYVDWPFVWIAGVSVACLVVGSVQISSTRVRFVMVNAIAVVLALGAYEAWLLAFVENPRDQLDRDVKPWMHTGDQALGYALVRGLVCREVGRWNGQVVYDVTYTVGADGLRIRPDTGPAPSSVLCFGGSCTFGQGLDDAETWPYRLGEHLAGVHRVYNFACCGYGTHQMLALLESGRVRDTVGEPVAVTLYLFIPDHVRRAAGYASWDQTGPWYILAEDGSLVRNGTFDRARRENPLYNQLIKSAIVRSLVYKVRQSDIDRCAAIILESRRIIQEWNAGCRFQMLWWGDPPADGDQLLSLRDQLTAGGVEIVYTSAILPEDPATYRLHEKDGHPNAEACSGLARYLADRILADPTGGARD